MSAVAWWNRPIVGCPVAWCRCPHRFLGDGRCQECQRRPANAEIHGFTRTVVDTSWSGEFGGTFTTYPNVMEDRALWRADAASVKRAARGLNRDEVLAWLRTTGAYPSEGETPSYLRQCAMTRQLGLWWPRSFITKAEASEQMNAVRASERAAKAA